MNSLLCELGLQFGQCFLSYTVKNYSYWPNNACQSFLCSDLREIISMILSGFEVTQLFFLYLRIHMCSHSIPISTEEAGSSHKGQLLCFTTSTSSRLCLHSFLLFQKGCSPKNKLITKKKKLWYIGFRAAKTLTKRKIPQSTTSN